MNAPPAQLPMPTRACALPCDGTLPLLRSRLHIIWQQAFATAAGVPSDNVQLVASAASVKLTATITVPAGASSTTVKNSIDSSLSSTLQAQTGVTVTSPPTTNVNPPAGGGGGDSGNPCFHRDATACRALDPLASPSAAYDACFGQGDTTLAARVRMGDLLAGDLVLSTGANFAPEFARVIVNQHAKSEMRSSLLNLKFAGGSVALTPDHVLFADGAFVGARHVKAGSVLEPSAVVEQVELMHGAVVNPITTNSRILAAGVSGTPVVSATHPEWIAEWMLTPSFYPLPLTMSNLLSYLFPATTQSFYDAILEPFFVSAAPGLKTFKAAVPSPLVVLPFAAFDLGVSAAFAAYSLFSLEFASLLVAVAVASKLLVRKA